LSEHSYLFLQDTSGDTIDTNGFLIRHTEVKYSLRRHITPLSRNAMKEYICTVHVLPDTKEVVQKNKTYNAKKYHVWYINQRQGFPCAFLTQTSLVLGVMLHTLITTRSQTSS